MSEDWVTFLSWIATVLVSVVVGVGIGISSQRDVHNKEIAAQCERAGGIPVLKTSNDVVCIEKSK